LPACGAAGRQSLVYVRHTPVRSSEVLNPRDLKAYLAWWDSQVAPLLDEMERLARRDLVQFLKTHNIRLPLERREQALKRILKATKGHYEQTVAELRDLLDMAREVDEGRGEGESGGSADYGY
jgi:hypothetical protein